MRASIVKTRASRLRPGALTADDRSSGPAVREAGERRDLISLYFRQVGRGALLTREQEAALGRRIEAGERDLRLALAAVPRILLVFPEDAARGRPRAETRPRRGRPRIQGTIDHLPWWRRRAPVATRRDPLDVARAARRRPPVDEGQPDRITIERLVERIRGRIAWMIALAERARGGDGGAGEQLARLRAEMGAHESLLQRLVDRVVAADGAVRRAKHELMLANLRLVISVAKRYVRPGLSLPDLVQEGNLGLMRAVDRFDHRHGVRFSTYATWWIRQAIIRSIANSGRAIRIPVHVVEELSWVFRARRELVTAMGREATLHELAEHTGVAAERLGLMLQASRHPLSLQTPVAEDAHLGEFLEDRCTQSPFEAFLARDLTARIARAVAALSPREARILRLRFGLAGRRERTLEEISKRFEVTRERIRQIEVRALHRLRDVLDARDRDVFIRGR